MRLATFNILHGRSPRDGLVDLPRYAAAIRALDADVLALQEVDRNQPRSHGADLASLAAEAMGALDYRFVAALSGTPAGSGPAPPASSWRPATGQEPADAPGYGIALLSRAPVRCWRVLRLRPLPVRVPLLRGRQAPVLVRDESRVAVAAVVVTSYGEVTVAATHLSYLPGWNAVQLRQLRRGLASAPDPVIVLGDLNMDLRRAARGSRMRALATGLTFPAGAPRRQIDHVLARGDLPPVRGQTVHDLPVSDHRALSVDF